jgi:hypothetical protein
MYLFKEQNRQYALLIENQKQQRSHLENQRQLSGGSNMVIPLLKEKTRFN